MAITVNGKKVAGTGPAGLSPYQVAKAGGYTGTEQEFNEALAKLNELFTSVSEGKSLIAAAVTDKGVETAADAKPQEIADNIAAIPAGGGLEKVQGTITGLRKMIATINYVSEKEKKQLATELSETIAVDKYSIVFFVSDSGSIQKNGGLEEIYLEGRNGVFFVTDNFELSV